MLAGVIGDFLRLNLEFDFGDIQLEFAVEMKVTHRLQSNLAHYSSEKYFLNFCQPRVEIRAKNSSINTFANNLAGKFLHAAELGFNFGTSRQAFCPPR